MVGGDIDQHKEGRRKNRGETSSYFDMLRLRYL